MNNPMVEPTNGQVGHQTLKPQASAPTVNSSEVLLEVTRLYDQGRYLDAFEAGEPLGQLKDWPGPAGQILAGRLAGNLGSPRLARALHWLAARQNPGHSQAIYYAAMGYWSRFGTVHAWRRYRQVDMAADADHVLRADWLALKATMLATMRDFSRAEPLMIEALELDPDSAWLHVELSELLDRQDLHQDSLMAAREALKLRPYFRPAVQAAAYRLVQLRRDDEAMQLLVEATERLQSGEVWCQLAALQRELKDYEASWNSLAQAEKFWPLAEADGQHMKWLAGERCDIACLLGRYEEAIALAEKTERPFFQRLVERLKAALEKKRTSPDAQEVAPRVQLPVPFVRQFHDTCVPATLTSIANYWQKAVKHEEIAERICYEGTRAYDERRWAEENGFRAQEFRITEKNVEQLIRGGMPMALTTVDPGSAHSQGIVGIDVYRGTLLIQDPNERHVGEAATDKFLEHYASTGPRGMVMVPREESQRLQDIELLDADLYDDHYAADCALARHDRVSAVAAVERMRQRASEHRLTLQCALSLARYDADPKTQLQLVDQLLAQFPTDANLLLMKISLLGEFGQRSQRIELLREGCQGEKTHPIFWSRLAAELLDDARDHAEAYYQLKRALRYNPSDGRALSLLADYYWSHDGRDEALEYYRLAASLNEKDESQSRRYFMAARYMNQANEALVWLRDRNVRFGDRNSSPGRTLAGALELIDQTPESFKVVEETVQRHPQDGELLSFASLYFGRYNQPEKAAEYLAESHGKCSQLVYLRTSASLALYQGDLANARELFLQVVRLDPLDIDARERVLQLDLDLDGPDVAEQRLRGAVSDFPHSYSLRVMLIQFLRSYRLSEVGPELDRFLEFHPRDAWGRREAGIAALAAHDLNRASHEINLAIELEPHHEIGYFLRGKVLQQQGDIAGARAAYRQALELNIDYEAAISSLIETCDRPAERTEQLDFILAQMRRQTTAGDAIICYRDAANGRMEPSRLLQHLEEAREQRPDLWQVWSVVVYQHLAMNQRSKAIEVAQQATERFPLVPRAWLDLAIAYRRAGDHDAELEALQSARDINPHWTEVARELCELYMNREQFDEAEQVVRQVLKSDPRDPASLAALSECLYRAGKKSECLVPMVAACSTTPGYDWAWSRLCEWSQEIDAGKSARAAAEQAIAARPHDSRCYRRMAEALSEIEDIPKALEFIDKSLQLDDRGVDSHVLKAYYLGRMHLWDEALEACNPPVFAGDVPVMLRMRRAYVLYRKGLTAEAIDEMQAALERDSDHYGAWNQLADWAEEARRPDVYKQAAENMVRLDPHQPAPRGYLADALLAEPDGREDAKKHLRTALEFSPDYAYGTMRLFELHLQDSESDKALEVLELGGPHLPPGHQPGLRTQLLAALDMQSDPPGRSSIDFLMNWVGEDLPERAPLLRAVDHIDPKIAGPLINQLQQLIQTQPMAVKPAAGMAIGRLMARVSTPAECLSTLKSLPDGESWHEATRTMMRAMAHFGKPFSLLDSIIATYGQRMRTRTDTWSVVAGSLLDYGQNSRTVKWTNDWEKRQDATASNLVAVVASRWELFQLSAARKATERGLALPEDDGSALLRVWAGLDAILQGRTSDALDHARIVSVHQMTAWYALGYRILVAALEALPGLLDDQPRTPAEARQIVRAFKPGVFPVEPQFVNDQLTKWLLCQLAARIAAAHGMNFQAWIYRLRAFLYTYK